MDVVATPSAGGGAHFPAELLVRRALATVGDREPRTYSRAHDGGKRALDTDFLREAAREVGIDVQPLAEDTSLFRRMGRAWVVYRNMPSSLSALDRAVTNHKHLTKRVLADQGLPVARGTMVSTVEDALRTFGHLDRPLVIKPVTGSGGRGVSIGITTRDALEEACRALLPAEGAILIEEMFTGIDLRIMTVAGQAVATSLRFPANVIGDGRQTIAELVAAKNVERGRNAYTRHSLIEWTDAADQLLSAQRLSAHSVPPPGERVFLHTTPNVSAGGDCIEVQEHVHPDLLRLAERAAACFPTATHAGLDILAERLDVGLDKQRAIVCEVNLNNEIPMHIMPVAGPSTPVHEYLTAATPPSGAARFRRLRASPRPVDTSELTRLVRTGQEGRDDEPFQPLGRDEDARALREEFLAAGYQTVTYRGSLIYLGRRAAVDVVHRSGRSVVSIMVGRRPTDLSRLAEQVGVPTLATLNPASTPPLALACHVLLIDRRIVATQVEALTPPAFTMNLPDCPYPELLEYATALVAPMGQVPVLQATFGLRATAAEDHVWALWRIDADPILSRYSAPAAGVPARVHSRVAHLLLKSPKYTLPPQAGLT